MNFRLSIQELRKTECTPDRLRGFAAYLINRINTSHVETDRAIAGDCLEYFNSLETCTLHDLLEISYILNGGVMLKANSIPVSDPGVDPLDAEDEVTVDAGAEDEVTVDADAVDEVAVDADASDDVEADREFQRLISEFEGISTEP